MNMLLHKWRLWAVLASLFLVSFILGMWLYGHSYIEIVNNEPIETDYTITFADTGETTSFSSSDKSIKKIMKKGRYDILAKNDNGTFYQSIKTSGFLSGSLIPVVVEKERSRAFAGDNPGVCALEIDGYLVSYSCTDSIESMKIHLPATETLPTFTRTPPLDLRIGEIEGVVKATDKTLALIYDPSSEDVVNKHSFYEIIVVNGEFRFNFITKASFLSPDTRYSFSKDNDLFIIHNVNFQEVFSGNSIETMTKVSEPLDYPIDAYLSAYIIGEQGHAYSYEQSVNDSSDIPLSEVVFSSNEKTKKKKLSGTVHKIQFCQVDRICVLNDKKLIVYNDSFVEVDVFGNALDFFENNGDLMLIKDDGVLRINPSTGNGSYDLLFNGYGFNAVYIIDDSNYMLSLGIEGRNYAFRINPTQTESDFLDRKILNLVDSSFINTISIYDKYIYISPELGEPTYNSQTGEFGFSNEIKNQAIDEIFSRIEQAGIDQDRYKVKINGL